MGFSIWLIELLALMPVFVLFAGLSAADGFLMPVEWIVLALLAGAALFVGWRATRDLDRPQR